MTRNFGRVLEKNKGRVSVVLTKQVPLASLIILLYLKIEADGRRGADGRAKVKSGRKNMLKFEQKFDVGHCQYFMILWL